MAGSDGLGGSWSLDFDGHTTHALPWDASPSLVQQALEQLESVGGAQVQRLATDTGFQWLVTFTSVPGFFPFGSGNHDLLRTNF